MHINLKTIWDEMRAADPTLFGSPLGIGADGDLANMDMLTEAQRAAVLAVIEAHDPNKVADAEPAPKARKPR